MSACSPSTHHPAPLQARYNTLMTSSLRPGEPLHAGLRRLLNRRLTSALRSLEDPKRGTIEERIHGVRKMLKRLRALLRVTRSQLGDPLFRQENLTLRDAGRRLAGARDSAVLCQTLADVQTLVPELDLSPVEAVLLEQRQLMEERQLADTGALESVAATLRTFQSRMEDWPLTASSWQPALDALLRSYRQANALWYRAALEIATIPELHEWRKRVKDSWYQLELLRELRPVPMDWLIHDADELGERLGVIQDRSVLEEVIQGELGSALDDETRSRLLKALRKDRKKRVWQAVELAALTTWRLEPPRFGRKLQRWYAEMPGGGG